MRWNTCAGAIVLGAGMLMTPPARGEDRRLLAPKLEWFDAWMDRTATRVPDFDALPSYPDLPPLLTDEEGRPIDPSRMTDEAVATYLRERWPRRREELKQRLCDYLIGHFPADLPAISKVEVLSESQERGAVRRLVALTYDTDPEVRITLETLRPEGDGPFPVFMTQATHRRVGLIALARGYFVCIYPGADSDDQTDGFAAAYPEADWGRIARRAWLGSRVLDYLLPLAETDDGCVAITGHSRNGKQSLIAAAFDERITAVVSSSSCAAGAVPFRFAGEDMYQESVEFMTRQEFTADWFHPRMRLFTGREDKLPVDTHALTALIAPRACLFSSAINDGCGTTFATERNYRASLPVYRIMGAPGALAIRWRIGAHEWDTDTAESYIDWFDRAFGRGDADFPEIPLHTFDFDAWKRRQPDHSLVPPGKLNDDATNNQRREVMQWMLGEAPPQGISRGGSYGAEVPHEIAEMGREVPPRDGTTVSYARVNFGPYVDGTLYYLEGFPEPRPVVIWLHPFTYSKGFVGSYVKDQRIYHRLALEGYAVFAFDQIGFGARLEEGTHFYDRYPTRSKLGRMVADVRAAIDFLRDGDGRFEGERHPKDAVAHPALDPERIYLVGYSLGGMVGLYAAAMDDRVAGVACYAGFTPMRTDTDDKPTGGIRRWWEWHGLLPKLGLFEGNEAEIPYDYHDVMALIAPRPCLVVSPAYDRHADHDDVLRSMKSARQAWINHDVEDRLVHLSPDDYSRFESEQQALVVNWLEQQARRK